MDVESALRILNDWGSDVSDTMLWRRCGGLELPGELCRAIGAVLSENTNLRRQLDAAKRDLMLWERDPRDAIQANPVDTIARRKGWLPLTPGEKMTVHFNGIDYVIQRGYEGQDAAATMAAKGASK